jgi:hypothetical protein
LISILRFGTVGCGRLRGGLSTCDRMLADANGDGQVDVFDIDPFVMLLISGD